MIAEATANAQKSLVQLDIAFNNSSESARRSKDDIVGFATSVQKGTEFSNTAVIKSQTTLLNFGRVTRDVFSRARQDVLDVSAALGIDLQSASDAVGRALESPAQGLRNLRQLNIVFSESQRQLIERLEATGHVYEAQNLLLDALEDHYRGAAKASSETLGGALDKLKNNFESLLELSEKSGGAAAENVNKLAEALSAPKLQSAVKRIGDSIAEMFGQISSVATTIPRLLGVFDKAPVELRAQGHGPLPSPLTDAEKKTRADDERRALIASLQEIKPNVPKEDVAGLTKLMRDFGDEAESAAGKASRQFERLKLLLDEIQQDQINSLTPSGNTVEASKKYFETLEQQANDYKKTIEEVIDDQLKLIDINAIESRKLIQTTTLAQDRLKEFTDTIKEGLQNAAQAGDLTGRSILRSLLAAFEAKLLYQAIDSLVSYIGRALTKAIAAGSAGGGSGFFGGLLGSIFGHAAGGGSMSGPRIVGEDGPELLLSSGQVMNRRQLAFAMAGSSGATIEMGDTNIVVQGNADERVLQAMEIRIQQNNKKQLETFSRILQQNGYGALR